jgi:hypothetical protein
MPLQKIKELKWVRWLITLALNFPWLAIAIGIHVIVGAVLSVIYIHSELTKDNQRDTTIGVGTSRAEAPVEVLQPEEKIDRKKIPENVEAELVSYEEETTFVPTELEENPDLFQDLGDPTGADDGSEAFSGGTAIGVGLGAGHYSSGSPSAFASRRAATSGTRKKGRRPSGQTVGTEEAVLEGLRWLIRHQSEDGSWSADQFSKRCNEKSPCLAPGTHTSPVADVGLTSISLLAFLGQGLHLQSKIEIVDTAMGQKHKSGDIVKKGIRWLIDHQQEDGSFTPADGQMLLYNEALATMALSECYGLSRNRELKAPAQKAVDFIVRAQKFNSAGALSGWRYGSREVLERKKSSGVINDTQYLNEIRDVDISVTCWVTMALKSAKISGLKVPDETMEGAFNYSQSVIGQGGLVGYQDATQAGKPAAGVGDHFKYHTGTMTALAMLVRTFVRHDLEDPFFEDGARHIIKDLPEVTKDKAHPSIDYYYWYHATMALNQFDGPDSPRKNAGKYWEPWNKALQEAILGLQNDSKEKLVCSRGGWLENDRWSHGGHAIYNTAINVLTLQVYYRYENAFGSASREKSGPATTLDPEGGDGK